MFKTILLTMSIAYAAAGEPVYVTPAGSLYHKSVKCQALAESRVWLTQERDELEAKGLKACTREKCWPRYGDHGPDLRMWKASVVALAAAQVVDIHSSMGLRELNPLLQSRTGTFDAGKGIALKAALVGAAVGTQWLVMRTTGGRGKKAFAVVNFIMAGTTAATAVRNYGIER
jgi:hypothetical protein